MSIRIIDLTSVSLFIQEQQEGIKTLFDGVSNVNLMLVEIWIGTRVGMGVSCCSLHDFITSLKQAVASMHNKLLETGNAILSRKIVTFSTILKLERKKKSETKST